MTNRWETPPLSLQTVCCRSAEEETCSTMLSLLIYRPREYTQSEWTLKLSTVSPLCNRSTPLSSSPHWILFVPNVIYSSILYICIYAKYSTILLNFLKTFCYLSHFYLENSNIQVLTRDVTRWDTCTDELGLDTSSSAVHKQAKPPTSSSSPSTWGQTQRYHRIRDCVSVYESLYRI